MQISLDDGPHRTVPGLLLARLLWSSAFTWNGSLLLPAQSLLGLLGCACLFCPHQVFCGHVLACSMAGPIGRALVTLSRWQPASPVHTHPWQQMDGASRHDPLADSWSERPCCGNPVCVCPAVEQDCTTNDSSGSKPAERSPPAGCIPDPWLFRTDVHWVPGSALEPSMALYDY